MLGGPSPVRLPPPEDEDDEDEPHPAITPATATASASSSHLLYCDDVDIPCFLPSRVIRTGLLWFQKPLQKGHRVHSEAGSRRGWRGGRGCRDWRSPGPGSAHRGRECA